MRRARLNRIDRHGGGIERLALQVAKRRRVAAAAAKRDGDDTSTDTNAHAGVAVNASSTITSDVNGMSDTNDMGINVGILDASGLHPVHYAVVRGDAAEVRSLA